MLTACAISRLPVVGREFLPLDCALVMPVWPPLGSTDDGKVVELSFGLSEVHRLTRDEALLGEI